MREYNPERNERDYVQFMDLIYSGYGEEAYGILRDNPGLMRNLRFDDIEDVADELRRDVGDKALLYFTARIAKLHGEIGEGISLSAQLDEASARNNLKRFWKLISRRHKRMLREMGDEDMGDESTL